MADRSVVRNQAYTKKEFSIRERHNERMNKSYYNSDILQERKHLNVHFKQSEGSYAEMFEKMLADGIIKVKGLKKDGSAKVFDEFVFDVNTEYFDRNGGYSYAKSFYEEAYRLAVQEAGGEEYILSAVMHADERNSALSEKLGRDVFHYHLHVVYVPVVKKEVYYKRNNKNPELAGKLKEVITQVSHSKKWPRFKTEKGMLNSYSLLQDRYHDHMKDAGFSGFERGERGSTTEHLETLKYKIQQDKIRATALDAEVEQKQEAVAALKTTIEGKQETVAKLDKRTESKEKQLAELKVKTAAAKKVVAEIEEIEKLGFKRTLFGNVTLSDDLWAKVLNLVKEALNSRDIIKEYRKKARESASKIAELEKLLNAKESEKTSIIDAMEYSMAKSRAPLRLAAAIADIKRNPPEHEQSCAERETTKKKGQSL